MPPFDVRLVNPYDDKLPTPVDEHGLIIVPDLIEAVRDTVEPHYEWQTTEHKGVHHIYWWEALYPNQQDARSFENPAYFRDLSSHRVVVPREFENWLHLVTKPCEPPVPDVMREVSRSHAIASSIYANAYQIIRVERLMRRRQENIEKNVITIPDEYDGIDCGGNRWRKEELARNQYGLGINLALYEDIPDAFRLFDPEVIARKQDPILSLATTLGALMVPQAVILTSRVTRKLPAVQVAA